MTKTKKKPVNRGLAPTPERVRGMRKKGWALSEHLAKELGVAQSTIKFWLRRGRIDRETETIKAYGNRWYSVAAVSALCPTIPEAP